MGGFRNAADATELSGRLALAAEEGDIGLARSLLAAGADPNLAKGPWGGILHLAALSSRGMCELLIDAGARGDVLDESGASALMLACKFGNFCAAEALCGVCDAGFAAGDGSTALHWAARAGSPRCAALLLSRGADPCAADGLGVTPAMAAMAPPLSRAPEGASRRDDFMELSGLLKAASDAWLLGRGLPDGAKGKPGCAKGL